MISIEWRMSKHKKEIKKIDTSRTVELLLEYTASKYCDFQLNRQFKSLTYHFASVPIKTA